MVMRKLLPIVLTACVTLLTVVLPADARRNSRTVRQERQRLERQARQTGRDLEQATALAAKQLRRIERLEADIAITATRERRLRRSVDSATAAARALEDSVARISAKVAHLDSMYRISLVAIRNQRRSASPIAYIFASESFAQAMRRMRYLGQLADWNRQQGRRLESERELLRSSASRLDSMRSRLQIAMAEQQRIGRRLAADRDHNSGNSTKNSTAFSLPKRPKDALPKKRQGEPQRKHACAKSNSANNSSNNRRPLRLRTSKTPLRRRHRPLLLRHPMPTSPQALPPPKAVCRCPSGARPP